MNLSIKLIVVAAATFAIALSTSAGAQQMPEGNGSAQAPAASGNGEQSAQQTAMSFDLNACENVGPGLFQCPASYAPICEPGYNRGDVTCLNVDDKGVLIRQGLP